MHSCNQHPSSWLVEPHLLFLLLFFLLLFLFLILLFLMHAVVLCMPQHKYCPGALLAGALRSIVDILQTLGGATLATTTVVLGASMFPQNKSSQTVDQQVTSGAQLSQGVYP